MEINKKLFLTLCTVASLLAGSPVQGVVKNLTLLESPEKNKLLVLIGETHPVSGNSSTKVEPACASFLMPHLNKALDSDLFSLIVESDDDGVQEAFDKIQTQPDDFHSVMRQLRAKAHDTVENKALVNAIEWREQKKLLPFLKFFYTKLELILFDLYTNLNTELKAIDTKESNECLKILKTLPLFQLPYDLMYGKLHEHIKKTKIDPKIAYNSFLDNLNAKISPIDFSFNDFATICKDLKEKINQVNASKRREKLAYETAQAIQNGYDDMVKKFKPETLDQKVIATIIDQSLSNYTFKNLHRSQLKNTLWFTTLLNKVADFGFIADIKNTKKQIVIVYAGLNHIHAIIDYFSQEAEGYTSLSSIETIKKNQSQPITDQKVYDDFFEKIELLKKAEEKQHQHEGKKTSEKINFDQTDLLKQKLKKLKISVKGSEHENK